MGSRYKSIVPLHGYHSGWAALKPACLAAVLFLLMALLAFTASAQTISAEKNTRVAILEFQGVGTSAAELSAATDQLRNDMVKQRGFTVLDRGQIEAMLDELAFQQKGLTDQSQAVKMGRMLNVQFIITGRLTKLGSSYQLLVQMIEVQTAKISHSETLRYRGSPDGDTNEGNFLGFLDKMASLATRLNIQTTQFPGTLKAPTTALAEATPPSREQPRKKLPFDLRIFFFFPDLMSIKISEKDGDFLDDDMGGDLLGWKSKNDIEETINITGMALGYERLYTESLSGMLVLHWGRVYEVEITGYQNDQTITVAAEGIFQQVSISVAYNLQIKDLLFLFGAGYYFFAADYSFPDILSGDSDTSWTITGSGISSRIVVDYPIYKDLTLGVGGDGSLLSTVKGTRVDKYDELGYAPREFSSLFLYLRLGLSF